MNRLPLILVVHPSDAIRGTASKLLDGKRIALCVTGSIAAVESVKLARELIRHGARVVPFTTPAAQQILHADALEFATGRAPVTRLSGQVEHLWGVNGELDAIVLAPATANTLAKVALAIDDNPVASLVGTSLGHVPVVIAPAMHEQMWAAPATMGHLESLRARGARIATPVVAEREAKMAPFDSIVEHTIRALGPGTLAGKRVLVVNGSTIEPMDDMRVITNKSTGRTGIALAVEAFRLGADVTLWFGHGHTDVPEHIPIERFVTVSDVVAMAPRAAAFDWVLAPAAISDFQAAPTKGKLSSGKPLALDLRPTEKVLPHLRKATRGRLVAFKAESGLTHDQLIERAARFRKENHADAVVANDLGSVGVDATRVHLVLERATHTLEGSKSEVARGVLLRLAESF